jgi:hypothetical protein
MAVATLWMISVGSDLELAQPPGAHGSDLPSDLPVDLPDMRLILGRRAARPRRICLFRLGWRWLLVQLIHGQPLPVPRRLVPEPWPAIPERLDLSVKHQKALSYAYM